MRVPVHGAILGNSERDQLHTVIERGWYTAGLASREFERKLRDFTGMREVVLCNSGSSANLLALSALAQPEHGERRIKPGDEVITAAVGFPTTVNPIVQIGAVPVFVDVEIPTMVPTVEAVQAAIGPYTKAVVLAHTLGYPLPLRELRELCDRNNLWLVADACDALAPGIFDYADMSTLSFFPAHHVTTGEGGAVLTRSPALAKILRSLRDWGRSCWCEPGTDDTCGKRFSGDYDHKYTYDRIGYHLAMTDLQAAIGVAQMDRLPGFVERRAANHAALNVKLTAAGMDEYFYLPPNRYASWFGYALICKPPIQRRDITRYLESRGIQTRLVFGGNLTRQPAYSDVEWYAAGKLDNADIVHERAFWVGCWPGITDEMIQYVTNSIVEYTKHLEG